MDTQYQLSCKEFGLRLAKLRETKGISARQMSLDIGQNKNYINSIESGHNYPSMIHFFDICNYLKITPESFFKTSAQLPVLHSDFLEVISTLSSEKFYHLFQLACDLQTDSSKE